MGLDVSAVVMIGIQFESTEDVEEFVRKHYNVDDEREIDTDDFEKITGGLEWQEITCYADRGGVLGVEVGEDDLNEGANGYFAGWRKAKDQFPKECYDDIRTHIWAQRW